MSKPLKKISDVYCLNILCHIHWYQQRCRSMNGWKYPQTIASLGFKPATFYDRVNDPRTFTFGELTRIADVMGIPVTELIGGKTV